MPAEAMLIYHPHRDEQGRQVLLKAPSSPTPLASWDDPDSAATVIPGGPLPDVLNGIALAEWRGVPRNEAEWHAVPGQCVLEEPPFHPPAGKAAAAGVIIREPDGRIWLVAPSNGFGGYAATFPKGRIDAGASLQACAIREAFEEAGLRVRIIRWLADSSRTQTYTRYYLAERTGGTPAAMGWESQAVHLVPLAQLPDFLTHTNDAALMAAIQALPRQLA